MLTRSHKTKISPRLQLRYIREHLVGRWNEDEVPNGSRNPMLQGSITEVIYTAGTDAGGCAGRVGGDVL